MSEYLKVISSKLNEIFKTKAYKIPVLPNIITHETVKNVLNNIETVHSRAEDLGHNDNYREKFDYCVSRAVANMSVLLEYCIPFIKTGGKFISYKSENSEDEVKQSESAQQKLGCKFIQTYSFELPGTDISRKLYVFEKYRKLGKSYPRQAGKPKKNPL